MDYKEYTAETYSILLNNTTLSSDNPLRFRKNLLKWIYNKMMTIDDQTKDEKLQYDINWEAAKISALLSGKSNKYEYLKGEEILPSNQKQIIEKAKFPYSPLGQAFEKKTNKQKKIKEINKLMLSNL